MFNPRIIPTILREVFVQRTMPREPEPDLVMDDPQQVEAYVTAGRTDGVMAAAYQFHSARISQIIQGCKTVLDLGCGPATQLCQVAELNPDINFIGMDLSPNMLADAEKHAQAMNIKNVNFCEGDITKIDSISDHSMDAVISTMTLHHLPSSQHLEECFIAINRVLKHDGALYLTDFSRLKSLKSIIFFAYMNAQHQPHIFSLDFERSLRAAFLEEDFKTLSSQHLPKHAKVISTFKVPLLVIIKTEDKPLPENLQHRIKEMHQKLSPRYCKDLDGMRFFFRLNGLKNDPFH